MAQTLTIRTASSTEVVKISSVGPQGPKGDKGDPGDVAGLPLTTQGDILYRGASENQRLPIGASGQVLKVAGGIPSWANESGAVSSVAGKTGVVTLDKNDVGLGNVTNAAQVTSVTGTAPIVSSGGTTPAISVTVGTTANTVCAGNDARLSDSRTPTTHAASHAAGTKAQFSGVIAGTGDNYLIQANNVGTGGNSITLSFNGTNDIDTVLAAWNSANPSNQAAIDNGDGGLVPNNGTSITLSGGTAAGSDPAFDQNLNTSNSPTFNKLTLTPDTNDSSLKLGTLEFQGYALNNAWIGDNVYFDGGNFKRRNVGAATLFYFAGEEGQFRCDTSDNAGTNVTINPVIKFGAGGTFAIGPALDNVGGFEGGMLYSDGNNIGFSDKTDIDKKATLDLSGITSGETRSLEIPDASGVIALTSDIPALGTGAGEAAEGNHVHGNLSSDGKLGSTAGLPVVTSTAGAVTTLALGTAGQVLTVNSGATGVEFAAASGGGVTGAASSASDVLGVSGSDITGVDANADRIIFWDDSASALKHLTVGSGLSLTDTTLTATGGGVTTGSVDNAIIRADGTGGSTSQSSDLVIDDATTSTQNNVTISNQHSGQTNSALVLAPKGNGPLLGQKPNGAASGGNSRGNYATDFQRERGTNSRVASGNYSVICGGYNNSATNTYAFVGSGDGNQATGARSVIVTGDGNTASGERSFIGAGNGCTASGAYSAILSGNAAVADRASLHVHASGRFGGVNGSAQRIHGIYFGTTTTNSAVTIVNLSVPASKVIAAIINIVGVKSDGSASAHFVRQYSVKNSGGTTSQVYAAQTIGTDSAASTSVTLSASDANDQLVVECTGIASETWRWVASVDAVEVSWAT